MAELLADGRVELSDGRVVMYASELTVKDILEIIDAQCLPFPSFLPDVAARIPTVPIGSPSLISGGGGGRAGAQGPAGADGASGSQGPAGFGAPFPLLAPNGSAAAPSYSFAGDTNIGMFRTAVVDTLRFSSGGVDRFRVTPTGAAITGKLTVTGSIDPTSVLLSTGTALFYESFDGSTAAVSGPTTGRIRYNDGLARWEKSVQGGPYTAFDATVSFPILAPDGSSVAPSYSFSSDSDAGFFRSGANTLSFSSVGTTRWSVSDTIITSTIPYGGPVGAAATPTYSFSADTNTGFYRSAVDTLAFTTAGVLRMDINTGDVRPVLPVRSIDGTLALPAYSFSSDTDTGVFRSAADEITLTTGGVGRLVVTSTQIILSAGGGSAAVPPVGFSTDDGFFSAIADTVSVTINGVETARVTTTQLLSGPLGTAAAPAYSSISAPSNGVFSPGSDILAVSFSGSEIMRVDAAIAAAILSNISGTAALPALSFSVGADTDTGFFSPGADLASAAIGGNEALRVSEPADGEIAILVRRNVGGTLTLERVTMDAADSGGVGFKRLRVPN